MPWREARLRLNSHQEWQASAKLSYDKVGGAGLGLDEEVELRYQHEPEAMDLSVSNDGGFFQRIVFSNAVLYRKYQNGKYVASKDLEFRRLHHADEAFALAATGWDLMQRFIALKPASGATLAGRPAYCYDLVLKNPPAPAKKQALQGDLKNLKGWRASLKVAELSGLFCVDRATATPLKVEMKAQAKRDFDGGSSLLNLTLKSGFLTLGKAPSIRAPEAYLKSLKRKRRKRGTGGGAPTQYLKREGINVLPRPDAGTQQ